MFHRHITEWTEADLASLIAQKVPESRTIDYKQQLPSNSDKDKAELCSDVSSFSNASGGYLIFGIKEDGGESTEIIGLDNINADAEKLRLEQIIQAGVTPRIPGLTITDISLANIKKAIVIHVPKSFYGPHAVIVGGDRYRFRFNSRSSAGKQVLDYQEVKTLFLLSEGIQERIRNFRMERISNLIAGETPVSLSRNPKVVMHLIPLMSFEPGVRFEIKDLFQRGGYLPPLGATGIDDIRYNFDGLLTIGRRGNGETHSYCQLFHSGIIEGVNSRMFENGNIYGNSTEKTLFDFFLSSLNAQKFIGVKPPFLICLTFIGMKSLTMVGDLQDSYPVDRDNLFVPPILVEEFENDIPILMKPLVDSLWNAAGYPESQSYRDGVWSKR